VSGNYSEYGSQTAQTYLRGIQTTDASGQVHFTTIYPGWYQGRATHIHIEVKINSRSAKVTRIAFPEAIKNTV
jgi:protocatechuate 3,4-dioxygenase beta subunit